MQETHTAMWNSPEGTHFWSQFGEDLGVSRPAQNSDESTLLMPEAVGNYLVVAFASSRE